jgi:hypothetical protein
MAHRSWGAYTSAASSLRLHLPPALRQRACMRQCRCSLLCWKLGACARVSIAVGHPRSWSSGVHKQAPAFQTIHSKDETSVPAKHSTSEKHKLCPGNTRPEKEPKTQPSIPQTMPSTQPNAHLFCTVFHDYFHHAENPSHFADTLAFCCHCPLSSSVFFSKLIASLLWKRIVVFLATHLRAFSGECGRGVLCSTVRWCFEAANPVFIIIIVAGRACLCVTISLRDFSISLSLSVVSLCACVRESD